MVLHRMENPFADLENGDELLVKHQAVEFLERQMNASGMTQAQLAEKAGLTQPQVSEMLRRHLARFGVERINRALRVFGARIETTYQLNTAA